MVSVELRFGGEPSRTDSTARDFGLFFLNGTWSSSPAQRLDLNVDLERSSLAEVSRLIDPRGFGVHGVIALQARLSGPPSALEISGQLQVDDVHRWDLVPQGGGWKLPFKGALDLRGEKVELAGAPDAPVSLSFRAWDFLSRTQWEAGAQLNQIPLAALAEVARHMGAVLPRSAFGRRRSVGNAELQRGRRFPPDASRSRTPRWLCPALNPCAPARPHSILPRER